MIRRAAPILLLCVVAGPLASCGDNEPTPAASTAPAKTTPADQQPSDIGEAVADEAGSQDSFTALALLRGYEFITKYCVRVIGAQVGQEEPPTATQRQQKNTALQTLGFVARDDPDTIFGGKTVAEWADQAHDALALGDCDSQGAARAQAIADKLTDAG